MPEPIYTRDNCKAAYQLNWSLSVSWREPAIPAVTWIEELKVATEPDGVRILEHRDSGEATTQFLVSATPPVAPQEIVRSVKARLQYVIRDQCPKAFRRNFGFFVGTFGEYDLGAIRQALR